MSSEMPLSALRQAREGKACDGFVQLLWWERNQGLFFGRALTFPFYKISSQGRDTPDKRSHGPPLKLSLVEVWAASGWASESRQDWRTVTNTRGRYRSSLDRQVQLSWPPHRTYWSSLWESIWPSIYWSWSHPWSSSMVPCLREKKPWHSWLEKTHSE